MLPIRCLERFLAVIAQLIKMKPYLAHADMKHEMRRSKADSRCRNEQDAGTSKPSKAHNSLQSAQSVQRADALAADAVQPQVFSGASARTASAHLSPSRFTDIVSRPVTGTFSAVC